MNIFSRLFRTSVGKKYLMALSGIVLVLFVLGHMVGNLQVFLDPYYINRYAHKLQSLGPGLWIIRIFLITCIGVHIWMAALLKIENRRARPDRYVVEATIQASYASRTMIWSGLILFAFIVFHLAHYTAKTVFDYSSLTYPLDGISVPDVHAMMVSGFSHPWVSLFYLVAMALLCAHLSHGVSSMFQSLGLRNARWRKILDIGSIAYGIVIFAGFASIPVAVFLKLLTTSNT